MMKKIFRNPLLWILIVIKILNRHKVPFFLTTFIIFLVIFAQLKYNLFYNQNSITLGLVGTYQEHDLPNEVTKLLSQGLVKMDENGRIKGNLVTGWDTNKDATDFKFKLKNNLKWVDHTPIKSQDMGISIPNIEVTSPDDQTIQFSLKESYSPLPSLLIKPIFKKGSLIGTGPYQITNIEKSRIFITKLELKSQDPNLPIIYVRFYPNEKVALTGFNLGEVQVLLGLSNPKVFTNYPNLSFKQETDYTKIVTVLFQTKDSLLQNRSLRQTLAFISPKLEGEEMANNPYPKFWWAYNPNAKKYLANLDEAKSAIRRAKDQIPKEKLSEEIVLTTTPNLEEVGNKVITTWKELDLNAKLRIESGIPQNFQALLITQSIPLDPDQYFLWHATQTKTNLAKYDSKRTDKDLEDGRKIITEEERKEKYFDFQKTILEDAPAVFLYFPKYNIVYLKKKEKLLDKILSLQ